MDAVEVHPDHDDTYSASTILLATTLQRYLLLLALALSSFIYGCKVTPDDFSKCVKKPVALWLAMMISVIFAPLTAYVLTLIFHPHFSYGLTLLVTSTCPAGALSPVFAFYTQSDVYLCLSVIVLSTLMSVGMIPLGVFICSKAYRQLDLAIIPNNSIVTALVVAIGCVTVGMTLRHHKQKVADRIVLALSYMPIAVIIIMLVIVVVMVPHTLHTTAKDFFLVFLYYALLLTGTYIVGHLSGLAHESCRAMALSSASKNILLANTIVHASFTGELLVSTLPVPLTLLIEYIAIGFLLTIIYRIYRYYVPAAGISMPY